MRLPGTALFIVLALSAPAAAQSTAPPPASEAPSSICAALAPDRQPYAGADDPFAELSVDEIEGRLKLEAPRRVRELDLTALMRCLTAQMNAEE